MPHPPTRPSFGSPSLPAWLIIATAIAGVLTGGCAVQYVDYTAFARTPDVVVADARYRIAPPDGLRVHSQIVREVDGRRVTVRRDGTIVLPLLGEIQAVGRTRFELAAALTRRASKYYVDPHVDVRVERYESQHVFVRGCVARPGALVYDGRNTALTALARAEPTFHGDPTRILVLAPGSDGRYAVRARLNLDAVTRGSRRARDIVLNAGEIVHVSRHPLAPRGAPQPSDPVDDQAAPVTVAHGASGAE